MKRKVMSAILAAAMVLSLTACGGSGSDEAGKTGGGLKNPEMAPESPLRSLILRARYRISLWQWPRSTVKTQV